MGTKAIQLKAMYMHKIYKNADLYKIYINHTVVSALGCTGRDFVVSTESKVIIYLKSSYKLKAIEIWINTFIICN